MDTIITIITPLPSGIKQCLPLAELGVEARSFAGDTEGCCVGRAWHCREAADGQLALGSIQF